MVSERASKVIATTACCIGIVTVVLFVGLFFGFFGTDGFFNGGGCPNCGSNSLTDAGVYYPSYDKDTSDNKYYRKYTCLDCGTTFIDY